MQEDRAAGVSEEHLKLIYNHFTVVFVPVSIKRRDLASNLEYPVRLYVFYGLLKNRVYLCPKIIVAERIV